MEDQGLTTSSKHHDHQSVTHLETLFVMTGLVLVCYKRRAGQDFSDILDPRAANISDGATGKVPDIKGFVHWGAGI